MTKTRAVQDCSRVQDFLVYMSQDNKQMTLAWWKVRKWQSHSGSRCIAANNNLYCFAITKKNTKEGKWMPKWSLEHVAVIKHGKHWLRYPIFHLDFSGGQMRNSLQHAGRWLGSSRPLTLYKQFNGEIVLLLHLKSLVSAFDMIYWAGKSLSFCINLGVSASPSSAPSSLLLLLLLLRADQYFIKYLYYPALIQSKLRLGLNTARQVSVHQ